MLLHLSELANIGFKKKETEKVISFVSVISPIFQSHLGNLDEVIDLCSGNGLSSFVFLLNGLAKRTLMYDIRRTDKFDRLTKLFEQQGFVYNFHQQNITTSLDLRSGSVNRAIISIHPCSELADRVIAIGLENSLPFAIMTCCHKRIEQAFHYKLKNPPDSRLMLYDEKADYFDLVRQRYIEEQGWQCVREEIPKEITEKNHVLIGVPK